MSDITFEVTRGKHKGDTLRVHQICNDWVTATTLTCEHANNGQPLRLASTYFPPSERRKLLELQAQGKLGMMFKLYSADYFLTTGTFRIKEIA